MSDDAVSIFLSDEERLFVDSQIAAGNYADDAEMLHAGLAALERESTLADLREMTAVADRQIERGEYVGFSETDDMTEYVAAFAELQRELSRAEASGESTCNIPDIMQAVKAKLRSNGSL